MNNFVIHNFVDGVNDTIFYSEDNPIEINAYQYNAQRMGAIPNIAATLMYPECLDDYWDKKQYIIYNDEKYYIFKTPSSSKDNTTGLYKHELQFVNERFTLENVFFFDVVDGDNTKYQSNSTNVFFYGDINEFADRLRANLAYNNLDYTVVIDEGITSESIEVNFTDIYILNALQTSFELYDIPHYFKGKEIHFGYTDNVITETFKYGDSMLDNSLLSIQKNNANFKNVTFCTGIGSEDNLPYYYPNESEERNEDWINPVTNLMPSIYRATKGAQRFYPALNDTYLLPDSTTEYYNFENQHNVAIPQQHKVDFTEIKPTIIGVKNNAGQLIGSITEFAYDDDDNDDFEIDSDGTTATYKHPYFYAKLKKFDGINGFNLFEHAIDTESMTIVMHSGNLKPAKFIVGVVETTTNIFKNPVQVDINGNIVSGNYTDKVKPTNLQDVQQNTQTNEVWIALKKDIDTFGVIMPNVTNNFKPSNEDQFVILGINLPQSYIVAAEKRLEDAIIQYMYENNSEKFNFTINFSRIFLKENPNILNQLNENARIAIEYNNKVITSYISNFTYNKTNDAYLPDITVTITDTITIQSGALQNSINQIKQDILSTVGGADFLKQGLKYFLRKDVADRTKGLLSSDVGFEVGRFISGLLGEGAKLYKDSNGKTNLELDRIYVRLKAYFDTIEINKMQANSGNRIVSAANMICNKVEDRHIDEDNNEIIWDFYRCYFKADDGDDAIKNDFIIGDMAMSRITNIKRSEQTDFNTRYYWREVVGVGIDYIDLSKSLRDLTSNDAPMPGDNIIQLGNKNDTTRQNAIEELSVGNNAPSYKLLKGIDDFSLTDKAIFEVGFNGEKSYFNSYGDAWIGLKDKSKGILVDTEKGEVEIRAKLIIKDGDNETTVEEKINSYDYLKAALNGSTTISGGLILTSAMGVGYVDTEGIYNLMAGIRGTSSEPTSIAFWAGGNPIDGKPDFSGNMTIENGAQYLIRQDGSGYMAGGAIWWDTEGNSYSKWNNLTIAIEGGESIDGKEMIKLLSDFKNAFIIHYGDSGGIESIQARAGLWNNYYLSAKGLDSSGGSGGSASLDVVWDALYAGTNEQINKSHLTDALSSYATQDFVRSLGYITSSSLQGYATENWVVQQGFLKIDSLTPYATKSYVEDSFVDVSMNSKNGVFTFTRIDGTTKTIDTLLEKVVTNFRYDSVTKSLILTLEDGSTQSVSMSAFIDIYTGVNTSTISLSVNSSNQISANINNGSILKSLLSSALQAEISTATSDIVLLKAADTSLSSRISELERMFEWSDGNIKAKAGLFTEQFLSARGLDSESGGGGSASLDAVWAALARETDEQIALSHLDSVKTYIAGLGYITNAALSGYATESWVTGKGYITNAALSGYATQSWVEAKNYLVESDLGGINLDLSVLKGYFTEGKANNAINSDGLKFAYVIVGKDKTILGVKNELKAILAANPYRTFYIQIKSGEQVAANWGNDSYLIGDGSTSTSWEVLTNVGHYAVLHGRIYGDRSYYQVVLSNNVWGTMRKFATLDDKVADSYKLGGIDAANYYHSGNANKDNVDWTANTLTASRVLLPYLPSTWINSTKSVSQILGQRNQSEASAHSLFTVETFNRHRVTFGGIGDKVGFWGFTKANIDGNVNTQSFSTFWYPVTGDIEHSHSLQLGGLLRVGGSSGQTVTAAKVELWDKVASWFAEDSDGNIYVRNAKGLYSNSFLSAKGLDSSGSGGGGSASLDVVWDALANTTTEQINITHLTNALSGYATQSWIISQGFATQTSLNAVGTRVGTLEGYFTSGKAKTALNAEQLGGQSPSYYATASGLISANSAISTLQSYFTNGKAKLAESADYLLAVDDRDVLPNTTGVSSKRAVKAFFRQSLVGSSGYSDLLVLDTHIDASGGMVNALQFNKANKSIYHFQVNQNSTSWGTGTKLAYITDTVADSLKLGGQLPSYYATALGLTTETNARIAADSALSNRIAVFESMFEWVDGDIRAKAGLFTNSFLSARGLDSSAGSSGAGLDTVWAALLGDTNEQINHSHLITALSTYATQSWVNTQGFLKSTALVGYATENWVTAKGYVVNTDYRLTDARNAKDVYSWAKQSTKPTYNWGEITNKPDYFTANSIYYIATVGAVGDTVLEVKNALRDVILENNAKRNFIIHIVSVGQDLINNFTTDSKVLVAGNSYTTVTVTNALSSGGKAYAMLNISSYAERYNYQVALVNDVWGIPRRYATLDDTVYNAERLGGQLPSYYGKQSDITRLDSYFVSGIAKEANVTKFLKYIAGSGTGSTTAYDANLLNGGQYSNYGAGAYWRNAPTGMSYGGITSLSNNYSYGGKYGVLSIQLAHDVRHNVTNSTKDLWFRTQNNLGWQNDWKQIWHSGNSNSTAFNWAANILTMNSGVVGGQTLTSTKIALWDKIASLFILDANNDILITEGRGLYSNSFLSARGLDSAAGGGSIDLGAVWDALDGETDEQINKSHLTNALSTYVETTDTRLTNARPASDVYTWAKAATKPTYSWVEINGRPTALSQFTKDINFDERYFTETEINTRLSGYLPLSGGTLTGGASISSNGNIYLQQASTSNATGMFWQNMANTTNLVGIGAYTTGDTINGIYMGWGSTPWEAVTNFRVTSTDIRYKNNIVYHAGNQSLIQAIKVNSAILSDEVFVSNTFNPTDLAVDTQRVKFYDSYNVAGTPTTYGNVMEINGIASHWKPQLWFDGGATPSSRVRYRNRTYNATSWGEWKTLAFTTDTAPDSLKLNGQLASYYATASGLASSNNAISTLQSYFTSGKAKTALNAEKLGNILAANYYHTANSNLSTINWNAKEYYASGWYRTTGDGGIVFSKYGGGFNMSNSTYVAVYGGKKFKVANSLFDSITTTGGYHTTSRAFGLVGTYDSAKTQAIWNMGGSYAANTDGSGLGNLYGAAYAYQSHSSVGNKAGGHQFLWCENGVVKSALGQNVWTSGSVLLGGTIEIKTSTITKEKVDRWDRICALFDTDNDNNVYVTNNKGLYSNSFVSARGLDEESSTIQALQAEITELTERVQTLEAVLGI